MERLVKMTAIPLFLIVILLIYVSISIFNSTNDFKKTAVPVTAVISNISTYSRNDGEIGHNVFVDYKYADKIYWYTLQKNKFINQDRKEKQFLQMIDDAKSGYFDLIVTKEVSRCSRNLSDSIKYNSIISIYLY